MRFDHFLSSFLLYITMLTLVVALGRMVSDVLLGGSTRPSRLRGAFRRLVLFCALAGVFVFALGSNSSLHLFGLSGEAAVRPFLLGRVTGSEGDADEESATASRGPRMGVTAVEVIGSDQRAALSQARLLENQVLRRPFAESRPACGGLFSRLSRWGMSTKEGRPAPRGYLLICAGDPVNWQEFQVQVGEGMNLLYIGAPPRQDVESLGALIGATDWRPAGGEAVSLALGGETLAFGGFPAGLEFRFNWREGFPLARLGGMARMREVDGDGVSRLTDWGALALRKSGRARIAWTSMPVYLWGKSDALYGTHLDFVWMRIFQHLFGLPASGIRNWPSGARAARVSFQRAETPAQKKPGFDNKPIEQSVGAYVGPWDATADVVASIKKAKSTPVTHFLASDISVLNDPQLKRREMIRWQGRMASLSESKSPSPLYVDPWQLLSAGTLLAVTEAGFSFVAGGKVPDRRTGVQWGFSSSTEVAAELPTWREWAASNRGSMVWQIASRSDDLPLADVAALGGLVVDNLTLGSRGARVDGLIDMRPDEALTWLRRRSEVEVTMDRTGDQIVVSVNNAGTVNIKDAMLDIDPGDWRVQAGVNLPASLAVLSPGELKTFVLEPAP